MHGRRQTESFPFSFALPSIPIILSSTISLSSIASVNQFRFYLHLVSTSTSRCRPFNRGAPRSSRPRVLDSTSLSSASALFHVNRASRLHTILPQRTVDDDDPDVLESAIVNRPRLALPCFRQSLCCGSPCSEPSRSRHEASASFALQYCRLMLQDSKAPTYGRLFRWSTRTIDHRPC